MRYFVYTQSEGEHSTLYEFSREELEKNLNDEYWGSLPILSGPIDDRVGMWIIAGSLIMPEPVKIVETWRVP